MTNLAGMCSNMSAEENYQKAAWLWTKPASHFWKPPTSISGVPKQVTDDETADWLFESGQTRLPLVLRLWYLLERWKHSVHSFAWASVHVTNAFLFAALRDVLRLIPLPLIAGAHVNPAVSLAMVILGKLPLKKFPVYVLAQFLGAFAGSCAVYGLYYGETGL